MDSKKEQLLGLVQHNPFISQQDLAERLSLSRSAVAGHIAALTRERRILGRAYVLPQRRPIVCIGGSNIDRKLRSQAAIQMGNSNPAVSSESPGGVARNVAENLARLGLPVHLLSAFGEDAAGRSLLAQAASLGVDSSASLITADAPTGSYTAVLNPDGSLALGLAQMDLCERMTPDFLDQCTAQRAPASLILLDLNLPAESIQQLLLEAQAEGSAPLIAVAVSAPKMARLPADLRGLNLLMLNRDELSACAGMAIDSDADLELAHQGLSARGLRRLIVTQGADAIWFGAAGEALKSLKPKRAKVVDVTGAGDAFAAGVCAGLGQAPDDLAAACRLGMSLARLTLQSEHTVSPELSPALLSLQN
ncbi:winged helix-turn-helix transcriptional regulator [Paucibacter sp. TC2R-5]|uniref:carbohydrate kinase n=1 Tax=Paucibacter sp. TC2R-5 TaxID=2893555 RepID=UPI0021E49939|nr:carbohydrate kinase [Paucibacter sp. TC2R-5]MCV2358103.1 winged helix-turn-helix transcriptional regulator [Paucibacter sp. TC2R-5]